MLDGKQVGLLWDIANSARIIQTYIQGMTEEQFYANGLVQDAVVRRLTIIGEAAGRIAPEVRARIPQIPWPLIVRMRNRLIHEYDNIRTDVIWEGTQTDLEPLMAAIEPWIAGQERIGEQF